MKAILSSKLPIELSKAAGCAAGLAVGSLEFGPDRADVGVVELLEKGQGSAPGATGALGFAGGVVGVAEAGERAGPRVAVAEVLVDRSPRILPRNISIG
jgi:hypothetical protein